MLALSFLRFLMYVQSFLLLDENVPFSSSDEIRELIYCWWDFLISF